LSSLRPILREKKGALVYAIVTPGYMMLGSGDVFAFCVLLGLYGIAGGNFVAISLSMKADLIEVAGHRTGDQVAGSYMAVWSLGQKFFQALGVGLASSIRGRSPMIDGFGLIAFASITPIIFVLIFGMVMHS